VAKRTAMTSLLSGRGTVIKMLNRELSVVNGVIVTAISVATIGVLAVAKVSIATYVNINGIAAKKHFTLKASVLVTFIASIQATVV
jgi:hypothetical protein